MPPCGTTQKQLCPGQVLRTVQNHSRLIDLVGNTLQPLTPPAGNLKKLLDASCPSPCPEIYFRQWYFFQYSFNLLDIQKEVYKVKKRSVLLFSSLPLLLRLFFLFFASSSSSFLLGCFFPKKMLWSSHEHEQQQEDPRHSSNSPR